MKKVLSTFTFVFILLMSSAVLAQGSSDGKPKPKFWWGPKVGVDLAKPTIDQSAIEAQIKSNYQAGLFFQFGRKFYIQPEVYYAVQKEEYTQNNQVTEETVNTLRVPVMMAMRLVNLKVISAHLMAGPSASILLNESTPNTVNPRPKHSFALQGGGGVDLIGLITLDVRYSVDLGNDTGAQIKQLDWDSGVNVTLGLKLR